MPIDVVIWGAGGHATVVAELIAACPGFRLAGFLVDAAWRPSSEPALAALILGGREQWGELQSRGVRHAIVAVGDNDARIALASELAAAGFAFPTLVSPTATVSGSASFGAGTVIFPGAVINAGARIGRHCIINSGAIVEHGAQLGDGVHVSPGAVLAGRATVAARTWIGAGATVIERITVGPGSIVGAGAVVVDNLPGGVVAFGVPARVRRPNGNS
jgi:sugar O-acyltransferase (sialic acid O-acetyltransferase NeuD family)